LHLLTLSCTGGLEVGIPYKTLGKLALNLNKEAKKRNMAKEKKN